MRKMLTLAVVLLFSILNLQNAQAQTVISTVDGRESPCGLSSAPYSFKPPKGTLSYYDFVSNLGDFYNKEKESFEFFGSYDPKTNSYRRAPAVAFVLNGFTPIELGSDAGGRRGVVYISILADSCHNLHMVLGGKTFSVARLSAHLRLDGTEGSLPPEEVHTAVDNWLVTNVLKKTADFNDQRKFIVIARPIGCGWQSSGELIEEMRLEFLIEDYYIPQ